MELGHWETLVVQPLPTANRIGITSQSEIPIIMRTKATVVVSLLLSWVATTFTMAEAAKSQCRGVEGWRQGDTARTFLWNPEALQFSKAQFQSAVQNPALLQLQRDADDALKLAPMSVTDKKRIGNGATKHDYASLAPYWWPDRRKHHGMPYVRSDGKTNPERDANHYDLKRLVAMAEAVEALGLMHYYSGEKRYADKAASLIRTWFLDAQTRMAPNMNFAQSIPGRTPGRAEGIIDLRHFIPVIETIGLIESSGALSAHEHKQLRDWFAQLVQWLASSALGKQERAAQNNHGIFYDLILVHFSLYSGYEQVAETVLAKLPDARLSKQIANNGSMPLELKRTRSFHYSAWTAGALFDLANLSKCFDAKLNLWSYRDGGKDLNGVTTFLSSYLGRETTWEWEEIKPDQREFQLALRKAAIAQSDPALSKKLQAVSSKYANDRYFLLWPLGARLSN
jgi:Alginate lyase